jgi:crotonobetainyl-CoA:carnitine CoA-transferase CaiB-like acyl-CoA transferase
MAKDLPTSSHMLYECADGEWIQICGAYQYLPLFVETQAELGFEEPPATDPPDVIYAQRCQVFRVHSSKEWLDALYAYDCPVAMVRGLGDLFNDDDVLMNRYAIDHEDPAWGSVRQAGWPFTIDPPMAVRSAAPVLGAHGSIEWDVRDRGAATGGVMGASPLQGLRVLDIGVQLAGPIAPMLMADLGADVIKIERPTGDPMRASEVLFLGCSRGKRSIALDLTRRESRPVLERLVRWADVVHHNMRMRAARKLGLDEPGLRALNPDVIFCHVSAYGPSGPRSGYPGYAPVAQAISGWHREAVGEGSPPIFYRFAQFDHFCGYASLVATLLAVLHRERTRKGTTVSASLVGAAAMAMSETMFLRDAETFVPYPRIDPDQTGLGWGYRIYRVAHGQWVAVAAVTPEHLEALLTVAGVARVQDLEAAFEGREHVGLLAALGSVGVPAEHVRIAQERPFFDDRANVRSRLAVHYPQARYGDLEQPGAFWNLGDMELALDLAPPGIGEHSAEVLIELGFESAEIEALFADSVVFAGT